MPKYYWTTIKLTEYRLKLVEADSAEQVKTQIEGLEEFDLWEESAHIEADPVEVIDIVEVQDA